MSERKEQWCSPEASALWRRFVAAGQQLQHDEPVLFPLVVDLVESVAEPERLLADELHELAAIAMHTSWSEPTPPSARPAGPLASPAKVLADWRLVDREALAVPLDRMELLMHESVAEIAAWARAVARARRDPLITVPPRPVIVEQLLSEVEQPGNKV